MTFHKKQTMTTKKEYLIYKLSDDMKGCIKIDAELFKKLDVKRGLRNENGTGVLVGLTNIGNVVGYERTADGLQPIEGRLYFRGYEIADLAHAIMAEKRFGFEPEITAKLASRKVRMAEVPISYYPRKVEEGKKINWKDGVRAIYCIVKYH